MRANTQPKQSVLLANAKGKDTMNEIELKLLAEFLNTLHKGSGLTITMKQRPATRRDCIVGESTDAALNRIDSGIIARQTVLRCGSHIVYEADPNAKKIANSYVSNPLHEWFQTNEKTGRVHLVLSGSNLSNREVVPQTVWFGNVEGIAQKPENPFQVKPAIENILSVSQGMKTFTL